MRQHYAIAGRNGGTVHHDIRQATPRRQKYRSPCLQGNYQAFRETTKRIGYNAQLVFLDSACHFAERFEYVLTVVIVRFITGIRVLLTMSTGFLIHLNYMLEPWLRRLMSRL
jgi:hypothetical protein